MSETATERGFTLVRTFDAPRELVFQAWTEPEYMEWYFNPSAARPTEPIEVDLRVGGAWRVKMVIHDELEYFTGGIYQEIVQDEKLVFTWGASDGWPRIGQNAPDDCPIVTIVLNQVGARTEMIFQVTLPDHLAAADVREWLETGMREGWSDTIDRLVAQYATVADRS